MIGLQENITCICSPKKQPDLNWENPQVRQELMKMIKFWLDKGVDGFRMDAINVISKVTDYPDAPVNGAEDHSQGSQFYLNGPRFVEFLEEIKTNVFSKYDIFTVGEMPNVTPEHGERYTDDLKGICSMLFHFELMDVDSGSSKWDVKPWKLSEMKRIMSQWQTKMVRGWNTLYLENHDQPRSISRFGDDKDFPLESSKMLATWLHMMQGTPFIYQGQELGMTNLPTNSIEDYKDIESLNYYKKEVAKNTPEEEILCSLYCKSRDNARTPMQWSDAPNAGFTDENSKPWMKVNPNYTKINAESALQDPDSLFYYYQKLIKLRKEHDVVVYGRYELILEEHEEIYAYTRTLEKEKLVIIANFGKNKPMFTLDNKIGNFSKCEVLINNYPIHMEDKTLMNFEMRPYEARVYKLTC
jgi:oligo-1,6-glucosidase